MQDSDYQLIPEETEPEKPTRSSKVRAQRLIVALVLTLLLAAGAIYSPLLWGNEPVSADSTFAPVPAPQLQVDDSLLVTQEALAALYEQVADSVVSIQVQTTVASPFGMEGIPSGGQGSGFIYDYNGHIVTNNHVVEDAEEIVVIFHNGFWADAELVAADPQADLAVIKVTPPDGFEWQPLALAEPDSLKVGHTVIALGNPFGLDSTMTTGIVSALGRGHSVEFAGNNYTLPEIIQTDAAINPGNSGGPLLNLRGEVVGVNFAIQSGSASNSGVGFTIPVSIIQRVVPALIEEGGYSYPFLGISGRSIDPIAAKALDLPNNQVGVYVADVTPGGPSAAAGIVGDDTSGDIIVAINGESVRNFEELVGYLITETSPNDTVDLTVVRNGQPMDVSVTLTERPGSQLRLTSSSQEGQAPVRNLTARDAIAEAVEIVEEEELLEGDIIQRIAAPNQMNGTDVWVVELSTENQIAHVTIDRATGDVLDIEIE